jgi:hypothetical protein
MSNVTNINALPIIYNHIATHYCLINPDRKIIRQTNCYIRSFSIMKTLTVKMRAIRTSIKRENKIFYLIQFIISSATIVRIVFFLHYLAIEKN